MSKYSVDFDITSVELLPIHKRVENIQNLLYSLVAPLNANEQVFEYLREGSSAGTYNAGTTYVYGDLINYQRRVYFRNEVTDGYVAGIAPNNTTYFVKVLDYQIGLDERIRFGNGKLLLEYALNRIFGTTFNQPPVNSDIYITRNVPVYNNLMIGQPDSNTSYVMENDTDAMVWIPEVESLVSFTYDYTIHVPVAVWTALAGTAQERDNIILSVLNKYKLNGYLAEITTY